MKLHSHSSLFINPKADISRTHQKKHKCKELLRMYWFPKPCVSCAMGYSLEMGKNGRNLRLHTGALGLQNSVAAAMNQQ